MLKKRYLILGIMIIVISSMQAQKAHLEWPFELEKELNKTSSKPVYKNDFIDFQEPSCQSNSERFFTLKHSANPQKIKYIFIGRVATCRTGGCDEQFDKTEPLGFEYFDYYMFFDSLGAVKRIKIYNYQASHGYEITAARWLKQFIGYIGKTALRPGKEVDAIAGATISVHAMTKEIEMRVKCLGNVLKNR